MKCKSVVIKHYAYFIARSNSFPPELTHCCALWLCSTYFLTNLFSSISNEFKHLNKATRFLWKHLPFYTPQNKNTLESSGYVADHSTHSLRPIQLLENCQFTDHARLWSGASFCWRLNSSSSFKAKFHLCNQPWWVKNVI